jgi:hypothetical protein
MAADELSEHEECERMTAVLVRLGVRAKLASTGGNCYAALVELNDKDSLWVTPWPAWSWSITRDGENTLAGGWDVEDIPRAAKLVKKLINGLGTVSA